MPTLQERMKAKAKKSAIDSLKEQGKAPEPKDGEDPNLLGVPEAPPTPEPEPKVPDTGVKKDAAPKKRASKKDSGVRQGLRGKLFFSRIRMGELDIDDAWPYWRAVVEDAHQHLAFRGNLQTLLQEHPGLAFFYRSILTDAQQTRRWMEMKAEDKEVEKYKWLMTSEEAKKEYGTLKTTEAAKFAKADEEVLNLKEKVRILADIEHHLDNVALGFQDRGIMLNRIVDVRKAGHEEVFIDSNLETDNR